MFLLVSEVSFFFFFPGYFVVELPEKLICHKRMDFIIAIVASGFGGVEGRRGDRHS